MDDPMGALRDQLLAVGHEVESRLQNLTEEDLAKPATWGGRELTVRFIAHRLASHARDHELQVRKNRRALDVQPTEAQMILAQAAEARMSLLGECIGLDLEQFEMAPAEGEWSVKEVLEHVIAVERRYLASIEAALGRAPGG
jgi:hypothetical protein